MKILSILCFPAGIVALVLAVKVAESNFWAIGASSYGFDAGQFVWGSLIAVGIVSLLLCGSGLRMINHPENLLRYFGSLMSLIFSLGLLTGGISALT